MNFNDLKGTKIVSVTDASELGTVDDLYLDLSSPRVVGVRVKTGGLFGGHKALLLHDVKSIGPDAVTIEQAEKLNDESAFPELKGAVGRDALVGARVISEGGTEAGTVADLDVDFSSGVISGYVLAGGLMDKLQHKERVIPASTVISIGENTIVVADAVVPA